MTSPRQDTLNQSTLVQRLRAKRIAGVRYPIPLGTGYSINPNGPEAADVIEALCEALRPFADLKYQRSAHGIISKTVRDMDPVTVTVTKAQMLGLLAAIAKATA